MTRRTPTRRAALIGYAASVVALVGGGCIASALFPGGFDWVYTVMSALASRKHNPDGAAWFAAGLALSMACLWPAVSWIAHRDGAKRGAGRIGILALRVGIVFGVLVGVERLLLHDFSKLVHKGHELMALLSTLGLYVGVLTLQMHRARRGASPVWLAVMTVAPLVAIGLSHLGLYLDQRDLGWVDRSWRDMGVPFWLSFAFWQWLAAAAIWCSLGQLVAARTSTAATHRDASA